MNRAVSIIMRVTSKDKILEHAARLFYRQGIRGTQVEQIIAEADVAKRTFYKHFPSKRDVVLAFLEKRHENWMTWFQEAVERNAPAGEARLLGMFTVLKDWFQSPLYFGCAFLNTSTEIRDARQSERQLSRRHKAEMDQLIGKWLEEANYVAPYLAQQLGLLVDGAIIRAQCFSDPEYADYAHAICEQLLSQAE